jgi:hypothetical protein
MDNHANMASEDGVSLSEINPMKRVYLNDALASAQAPRFNTDDVLLPAINPMKRAYRNDALASAQVPGIDTAERISVDVNGLLQELHTIEADHQRECKVQWGYFGSILNARKEVQLFEMVVTHLSTPDAGDQRASVIKIKHEVRTIERIFRRVSRNELLPKFEMGLPSRSWEIEMAQALCIQGLNWEAKLEEAGASSYPAFQVYKSALNDEYQRWKIEIIETCKIEKIDRETTAKAVEVLALLLSSAFSLCIPIVIGLLVNAYLG